LLEYTLPLLGLENPEAFAFTVSNDYLMDLFSLAALILACELAGLRF